MATEKISSFGIEIKAIRDKFDKDLKEIKDNLKTLAKNLENNHLDIDNKLAKMKLSEVKDLQKQLQAEMSKKIKLNADFASIDKTNTELERVNQKLIGIGTEVKNVEKTEPLSSWSSKLGVIATTALSVAGAIDFIRQSINKSGDIEQYKTSMTVMLGSADQAQKRLEELIKFAAETPFEIPDVVKAANQLQAIGKYSQETLRYLGDLASASGKPFEQVLSAFAKLASGQKGIAVDMFRDLLISTKDWVDATNKGISKSGEMMATSEEMLKALPKIIDKKHFTGMMEEQSRTMKGQLSNLSDAFGQFQTEVGNAMMPMVKSITDTAIPALHGLKGNVDLIISSVKIGAVAFVGYELAVNGVTIAKKALSVATKLLKMDMESLKATMATNPIGLLITALTTAGVAVYELNKAYGNTIENQEKALELQKNYNTEQQKHTQHLINVKSKTDDVLKSYAQLYKQYTDAKTKADERQQAEKKLHDLLVEQQKVYPNLITNTFDYAKGLEEIKKASSQAVDDVRKLTGELNEQQKALANIQMAQAELEAGKTIDEIIGKFDYASSGRYEEFYFEGLAEQIRNGSKKHDDVIKELQKKQSDYSKWAVQSSSSQDKTFNIEMVNLLQKYISNLEKLRTLQQIVKSGQGVKADDSGNGNTNTTTSTTGGTESTLEKLKKEIEKTLLREKEIKMELSLINDELSKGNLSLLTRNKLLERASSLLTELHSGEKALFDKRGGVTNKGLELTPNGIAGMDINDPNRDLALGMGINYNKSAKDIINPKLNEKTGLQRPEVVKETTGQLRAQLALSTALEDSFNSAGQSLASGLAQSVKIFGEANSLAEQFINNLIQVGIQSLALSAIGGIGSGGILGIVGGLFGAHNGGTFINNGNGIMKMATGGSFIVPPGYNNDSFPLMVESGEKVTVTPASQVSSQSGVEQLLSTLINRVEAQTMATIKNRPIVNVQTDITGKEIVRNVTSPAEKKLKKVGVNLND